MKLLIEPSGSRHRLTWMVGALALVSCVLLGLTARAHASETIYWDNYHGDSIGAANIDGSGGHLLGLGRDHTIFATRPGKVSFHSARKGRTISVLTDED